MARRKWFVVKWGTVGAYPFPAEDEDENDYDEVRIEADTDKGPIELDMPARDAKVLARQIEDALRTMKEERDDGEEEDDD